VDCCVRLKGSSVTTCTSYQTIAFCGLHRMRALSSAENLEGTGRQILLSLQTASLICQGSTKEASTEQRGMKGL